MTDGNAELLRCRWPGCYKSIWVEKHLEICQFHAHRVLDMMMGEARRRISAQHGPSAAEVKAERLQAQVERLTQTIQQLREQPAPKPIPTDGTVYILRCGGYIKIGWTADLTKRMRAYQPDTLLLATMPGTRKDENALHRRFAHLRTHGREWYPLAPQLTEYVATVVAQYGAPEQVTFAAQPVTPRQPRPKAYVGGNYRGNGLIGNPRH